MIHAGFRIDRWRVAVVVACLAVTSLEARQGPTVGKTKNGIAYDVQGTGPAVVLITGSNLDRRMWAMMQATRPAAIDRLDHVKAPTLIVVGERDTLQRDQADLLAKQIPGAHLVVVPDGGHLVNLTSPAAFDTAVRDFLKRP